MTRPMVTIGIPFLAACFAASFLPFDTGLFLTALLAVLLLAALFFAKGRTRVRVSVVLLSAMAGVLCWQCGKLLRPFDFSSLDGQTVTVAGRVQEWERRENGRISCTLAVSRHTISGAPEQFTALVYLPGETDCDWGCWLEAEGKTLPMSQTAGFDMKLYYQNEGIDLLVSSYAEAKTAPAAARTVTEQLAMWNAALCRRVDGLLPVESAALVKAILLGNDREISDRRNDIFQVAGVSHIFVVSGLHISLIAGLVYALLKRLRCPPRACALFSCGAAWFFALLTGGNLPAVRAAIMATVLLAGTLFHRPADGLNSLLLAGTLIVLASPVAIVSGSFQLSFSATAGAVVLARPITKGLSYLLSPKGRLGERILSLLGMTFGCTLAMLPATLGLFGGVSLVSPLANLLAVPLLPVLLLLSALLLLPIPLLPDCAAALLRPLFSLLEGWCGTLSRLPFAYLGLDYPYVGLWCALTCGILAVGWLLMRKRRIVARLGLFSLCVLAVLGLFSAAYNRDMLTLTPVTSFESAAVVVARGERADVIFLSDDDYLGKAVLRFLRSRNIRRIDNLILAAANTDHVADEELLCAALPVGNLVLLPENELAPYAGGLLAPENGVLLLEKGDGYALTPLEQGWIGAERVEDGIGLSICCGETRVWVGDSVSLMAADNSENLFYSGKSLDFPVQNTPEYGILLRRPEVEGDPPPEDRTSAWEKAVEVRIAPDGIVRY